MNGLEGAIKAAIGAGTSTITGAELRGIVKGIVDQSGLQGADAKRLTDTIISSIIIGAITAAGGSDAGGYAGNELKHNAFVIDDAAEVVLTVGMITTAVWMWWISKNNKASDSSGTGSISNPVNTKPEGLVGADDKKSGWQGQRWKSGPLAPEHGGTGDAEKDFEKITGGVSRPPKGDETFPAGAKIGPNGEIFRPGKNGEGPRIDIPAKNGKPRETLHYP